MLWFLQTNFITLQKILIQMWQGVVPHCRVLGVVRVWLPSHRAGSTGYLGNNRVEILFLGSARENIRSLNHNPVHTYFSDIIFSREAANLQIDFNFLSFLGMCINIILCCYANKFWNLWWLQNFFARHCILKCEKYWNVTQRNAITLSMDQ